MIMALTIQQGIDALSTRISSKNEGSYQGGENMYLVFTQDIRQQRTICSLPFLSPQDAMTVYNNIFVINKSRLVVRLGGFLIYKR
jgi:hypothetical protein